MPRKEREVDASIQPALIPPVTSESEPITKTPNYYDLEDLNDKYSDRVLRKPRRKHSNINPSYQIFQGNKSQQQQK